MDSFELTVLLRESGLTNTQFAKITKLSNANISNWKKKGETPGWVKSWLENYIKAKKYDAIADMRKKDDQSSELNNEIHLTHEYIEGLMNLTPLTQADFCRLTGMSHNGVEKWKKNKYPLWVKGWLKGYIARESIDYFLDGFNHLNKMRTLTKLE